MTMMGMDPEQIRALADRLEEGGDNVDQRRVDVDNLFENCPWIGYDADYARQEWSNTHSVAIAGIAQSLRDKAQELRAQAAEQDDASAVNDVHGGGTGDKRPQFPAPCDVVDWLWDGAKSIGKRIVGGVTWVAHEAADGVKWVGDRIVGGARWIGNRISDGISWAHNGIVAGVGKVKAVMADLVNRFWAMAQGFDVVLDLLRRNGQMLSDWILKGDVPKPAQILGSSLMLGTSLLALPANFIAGKDLHLLEEGKPQTGNAQHMTKQDKAPQSLQDIVKMSHTAYENNGIRVMGVVGDDGKTRFIVSVPGTRSDISKLESWGFQDNALNWGANLFGVVYGESSGEKAAMVGVDKAIQAYMSDHPDAVIGDRPELFLTGHSQGGIITANMASNEDFASRYKIDAMLTNGSPIDCADIPKDVPVLALQNGPANPLHFHMEKSPLGIPLPKPDLQNMGDFIPRLDLGGFPGSPENVTHGYLPVVDGTGDPRTNHPQEGYYNHVLPGTPGAQILDDWQEQNPIVDKFLQGDQAEKDQYFVEIGRTK